MKESKEQEISLMASLYTGCSQVLDEAQRRRMLGEMVLKADCRGTIAMLTRLTGVSFYTIKSAKKKSSPFLRNLKNFLDQQKGHKK